MSYPTQCQPALQLVSNLDFPLPTHRQNLAIAKVKSIVTDAYQLVLIALQKQLFLKHVGMLPDLKVGLVKVLLIVPLFATSFGKLQKKVILDILQFDS